MRKLLLMIVMAGMLASSGVGHAASITACKGTAGPNAFPPAISGRCGTTFAMSSSQSVTLTISVDPGFTGQIKAAVTRPGAGFSLRPALFIGGQLISGAATVTSALFPASDWKLVVETYGRVCSVYPIPGTPACVDGVEVAVGSFAAALTVSVPGEPA